MEMTVGEFWLPLIFAGLLGLAILIYVVLDGFDLGVGILMARTDVSERDRMIASIGPFWDANETWLVLGVGLLLVAFPVAPAAMMVVAAEIAGWGIWVSSVSHGFRTFVVSVFHATGYISRYIVNQDISRIYLGKIRASADATGGVRSSARISLNFRELNGYRAATQRDGSAGSAVFLVSGRRLGPVCGPGKRVLDDLVLGLDAAALEDMHDLRVQPADQQDDCADHRNHQ